MTIEPDKKIKICRVCDAPFLPFRTTQATCSQSCALQDARNKLEKKRQTEWRREKKKRLDSLKSRSDWLKDAQKAFNAYIRKRDEGKGCISCGYQSAGQYHAGHYRTVKAASHLRFNEDNCHLQCAQCNNFESANLIEYRISLVKKIGLERVEALENDNRVIKWTVDEIKEIRDYYRWAIKQL